MKRVASSMGSPLLYLSYDRVQNWEHVIECFVGIQKQMCFRWPPRPLESEDA